MKRIKDHLWEFGFAYVILLIMLAFFLAGDPSGCVLFTKGR